MRLRMTTARPGRDGQRQGSGALGFTVLTAALIAWFGTAFAAEPAKTPPAKRCEAVQPTLAGDENIEWSGPCRGGKMFGNGVMTWRLAGQTLREFEGELTNGMPQGKGVLRWSDGRRFEGTFVAGQPMGLGVLSYESGDRFEGAIVNGLPEGRGLFVRSTGDRYEATFSAGEVQGPVEYAFGGEREGERFVGSVDQHRASGEGSYFNRDGSSFMARLVDGRIVSADQFKYADGARWQGALVDGRPDGRGSLLLANGDRIEGRIVKEQFTAGASYHFADGARFIGTLEGNRPRGRGLLILPNGDRVHGEIPGSEPVEPRLGGDGQIVFADGRVYVGPIERNLSQGRGVLTLAGGEKIDADFRGGTQPLGSVGIEYPNGDRYAGEVAVEPDVVAEGRGVLTSRAGHRYGGQFAKGLPHGAVEVDYADGTRYEGDYADGERSGKGSLRWPDGAQYEGAFSAGLPHGEGTLSDGVGVRYSGEFARGVPAGEGRLELPSGKVVAGVFRDGLAEGKATITMPDKSRFLGKLAGDRIEGRGTYVGPDGKKTELSFTSDLPKADDGPFFGLFNSKAEEIGGLIGAGFYPWAQRYYLANRKYFEEKKKESAALYEKLRGGLAEGFAWREKHLRRLARLPLLDAGRLRADKDLAQAGTFAEAAREQQAAARAVPLLADGFGSGQNDPVDELKPLWSAAYGEAMAMAIAAGRLDEADRISQVAGERRLQPINKAVDAALNGLMARNPLLVTGQRAAFDRLREDGVELDMPVVEAGLGTALDAALREDDVDRALALLALGQQLELKLLGGERAGRFAGLLAQRIATGEDYPRLIATLETLNAHGAPAAAGELHAAWLEIFAKWVEKGEVATALEAFGKVSELGLKLASPPTPAAAEAGKARLVAALTRRLDAYDPAGWLQVVEALNGKGLDLAPVFRKTVVALRAGSIGSRSPFSLSIKSEGLFRFKVLDDLLDREAAVREELAGAGYVLVVDLHSRFAVRRFTSLGEVASSFPDGTSEIANPAYLALEQELAEAEAAAAKGGGGRSGLGNLPANSGNRSVDNMMSLLNVIGAVADASSAGDAAAAAAKAQALRSRLASTPRTLSKPKIADYNYRHAAMEVQRVVPATLYVINLGQQQFVRRPLAFVERESFETNFGIHPKDKSAQPGERPDRARQLERKAVTLSFSDLVLAPRPYPQLLGGEPDAAAAVGDPMPEPLAGLPAALEETRDKRDAAALRWLDAESRKFDGDILQILAGLHEEGRQRSEPMLDVLRIPSDPAPEGMRNGAKLGELLVKAALPVATAVAAAPAAAPVPAAEAGAAAGAAVPVSASGGPAPGTAAPGEP